MTEVLAIREKHDGALGGGGVRLWLRLLSCTMAIEKDAQRRLSARGATLARFDMPAALDRDWIDALLAAMDADSRETLYQALGALKRSIAKGQQLGS